MGLSWLLTIIYIVYKITVQSTVIFEAQTTVWKHDLLRVFTSFLKNVLLDYCLIILNSVSCFVFVLWWFISSKGKQKQNKIETINHNYFSYLQTLTLVYSTIGYWLNTRFNSAKTARYRLCFKASFHRCHDARLTLLFLQFIFYSSM